MTDPTPTLIKFERAPCLDETRVRRLEVYKKPPTYKISRREGVGYFMDPPGFPTYFLRNVYTQYGNTPPRGPDCVICLGDTAYRVPDLWDLDKHRQLMRRWWAPLPLEHERTTAWIRSCFAYFVKGWQLTDSPAVAGPEFKGSCKTPDEIKRAAADLGADLAKYRPVAYVREFYPDADPEALVNEYGNLSARPGDWWERFSRQPSPDECPGDDIGRRRQHPTSGTWCQFCGWQKGG